MNTQNNLNEEQMVHTSDVATFIAHYREQVILGLRSVSQDIIRQIALLVTAILQKEGTVFIFGNGGSHAIARHFELTLKGCLQGTSLRFRTNCGIDPHSVNEYWGAGHEDLFVNVLQAEKADPRDVVILISGSGDSENLVKAVRFARSQKIPTVSFSGFGGGKISKETDLAVAVPVNDQQMVEDVIQPLLRILVYEVCYLVKGGPFGSRTLASDLLLGLGFLKGHLVLSLGKAISNALVDGRSIYVLAPEGGGMSVSAEHIAHNFNWDSVYGIAHPPKRHIYSTPTFCDYSGVGNDRLVPGIVTVQQLDKAQLKDLLLLFAHDTQSPSVFNVLRKAKERGMEMFMVFDKGERIDGVENISLYPRWGNRAVAADLLQIFGHVTARVARLCMKLELGEKIEGKVEDLLIREDLAQRRLLAKGEL